MPTRVLAALLVIGTVTGAAGPADAGRVDAVGRVVIISVPAVSWQDLRDEELPNIRRILDAGAQAAIAPRTAAAVTTPADAFTTLGAGTRSRAGADASLAFSSGDADVEDWRDEYAMRFGSEPPPSSVFTLAARDAIRRNDALDYGAEPGLLGSTLADAGLTAGVIGNADRPGPDGQTQRHREAVAALADPAGLVPAGEVGQMLVASDADAPFGVRTDPAALRSALDAAAAVDVLLIEPGGLARWDAARRDVTGTGMEASLADALADTDAVVGVVLERIDLDRDIVMLVGTYPTTGRDHLTPLALAGTGVEPGLLRSASTRRSGFVLLTDIAPTVLDRLGIERPPAMEGRPVQAGATAGSLTQRLDLLVDADRDAAARDGSLAATTTVYVVVQVLVWGLAWPAVRRDRPTLGSVATVVALGLLFFFPVSYLVVAGMGWGPGAGVVMAVSVAISVVVATVVDIATRRRPVTALLTALVAILALLVVDLLAGARLQLNAPFGYSPVIAGRFAGLGNLAFAQVAAAALIAGGLLVGRRSERLGWLVGAAGGLVVLVGAPFWGADVGGVLSLVPAMAVTVWLLSQRPLGARSWVVLALVAIAAVGAFAVVDLLLPRGEQSHLARLVESVGDQGLGAFTSVVSRKVDAILAVVLGSFWALLLPVIFAGASLVFWQARGSLTDVVDGVPGCRPAVAGVLVGMALGFSLNDSGIAVPAVMIGILNASLAFLYVKVHRVDESGGQRAGHPEGQLAEVATREPPATNLVGVP